MTTLYAETPFLMDLALRRERGPLCDRILRAADADLIEFGVPALALFESLHAMQGERSKSLDTMRRTNRLVQQFRRTKEPSHVSAAAALEDADLHVAKAIDLDRSNLLDAMIRVAGSARLLTIHIDDFIDGNALEATGTSAADAILHASIIRDMAALPDPSQGALIAFDGKAITPTVREALRPGAVISKEDALVGWLGARGIELPE